MQKKSASILGDRARFPSVQRATTAISVSISERAACDDGKFRACGDGDGVSDVLVSGVAWYWLQSLVGDL